MNTIIERRTKTSNVKNGPLSRCILNENTSLLNVELLNVELVENTVSKIDSLTNPNMQ